MTERRTTKPTHTLCMKTRDLHLDKWVAIGSGWLHENDNGNYVSIRLNRGVTLSWRDMADMKVALFDSKKGSTT